MGEVKDKDMDKDKERRKEKMKENDKEKVSATNNIEKSVLRDIEISENGRDNTLEMESIAEVENNIEIVKENLVNILDESKDKNRDIFNNENRKGENKKERNKNENKDAQRDMIQNNYQNENKISSNKVIDDTSYEIKSKKKNENEIIRKKQNSNDVESNTVHVKDQNSTLVNTCAHVFSSNVKAEIRDSKDELEREVEILVEGESNIDEDEEFSSSIMTQVHHVPMGNDEDRLWNNNSNSEAMIVLSSEEEEEEYWDKEERKSRENPSSLEEKEADDEDFGACMSSPPPPRWRFRKGDQSSYAISMQPYNDINVDNFETGVSKEKRTSGELLKQVKLRKKLLKREKLLAKNDKDVPAPSEGRRSVKQGVAYWEKRMTVKDEHDNIQIREECYEVSTDLKCSISTGKVVETMDEQIVQNVMKMTAAGRLISSKICNEVDKGSLVANTKSEGISSGNQTSNLRRSGRKRTQASTVKINKNGNIDGKKEKQERGDIECKGYSKEHKVDIMYPNNIDSRKLTRLESTKKRKCLEYGKGDEEEENSENKVKEENEEDKVVSDNKTDDREELEEDKGKKKNEKERKEGSLNKNMNEEVKTAKALPSPSQKRKRGEKIADEGLRIMFTGIGVTTKYKKMIESLGGTLLDNVNSAAAATHVIAGDGIATLRRTPKFMICMCRTGKILDVSWLIQSFKAGKRLNCQDFILLDKSAEKKYEFTMTESIHNGESVRASRGGLLGGYSVHFCKGVAGNSAPPADEMELIVSAAGGFNLRSITSRSTKDIEPSKILIITSNPAPSVQLNLKDVKRLKALGSGVFNIIWLFRCITTQNLQLTIKATQLNGRITLNNLGRKEQLSRSEQKKYRNSWGGKKASKSKSKKPRRSCGLGRF